MRLSVSRPVTLAAPENFHSEFCLCRSRPSLGLHVGGCLLSLHVRGGGLLRGVVPAFIGLAAFARPPIPVISVSTALERLAADMLDGGRYLGWTCGAEQGFDKARGEVCSWSSGLDSRMCPEITTLSQCMNINGLSQLPHPLRFHRQQEKTTVNEKEWCFIVGASRRYEGYRDPLCASLSNYVVVLFGCGFTVLFLLGNVTTSTPAPLVAAGLLHVEQDVHLHCCRGLSVRTIPGSCLRFTSHLRHHVDILRSWTDGPRILKSIPRELCGNAEYHDPSCQRADWMG